ncbi:MAG: type II toxin-antitoxin system mRNA interferase toxin, RelE/StbE family [Candidatus Levybacteria bacterium]|nr:type II toxin-antitoxin system mRNA interferase toxin, RelE/StbE family [Candidatus Levybacteria bacterium]
MRVEYDPDFLRQLKKLDVRIRNRFKEVIIIFSKDPINSELNNHKLKDEWAGYRSINVTNDYRAIYEVVKVGGEAFAYFSAIGTHEKLYS